MVVLHTIALCYTRYFRAQQRKYFICRHNINRRFFAPNIEMGLKTPYLEAIQSIPGETAHEKYCWIATEIKAQIAGGASLEEIVRAEKFPQHLSGLFKIEAAKILNRTGHKSQGSYEAIAESLKSENSEIVTRALQANEFFNGTNMSITNVDYFINNLFPYVSYNTRCKMVRKLARCLFARNTQLAEKFYEVILSSYGIDRAMPLLPACSEPFIIDMIVKHRIVLSMGKVKVLYKRYPNLVVWYLKLSNPALNDPLKRSTHHVNIHGYVNFLPRLIKGKLTAFIEIYEMHGGNVPSLRLSNRQAKRFAQNAREHYLEKPKVFFKLLIPEKIREEDMKAMLPKMLPDKIEKFDTNRILQHLKHYPKKKSVSLLLESYENAYEKNLLDKEKNVTAELMKILPAEERVRQGRIKVRKEEGKNTTNKSYEHTWRCYLPTEEVLPKIREQIAKTPDMYEREILVSQMLFCCEVNEDHEALLEVFEYVRDRHRNEMCWFHHAFIKSVQRIHDTLHLSKDHNDVLFEIVRRMYVKAEISDFHSVPVDFLEKAVHFRLNSGSPPEPTLEMIFFVVSHGYYSHWNLLTDYAEYERLCLLHFLRLAEQERNAAGDTWDKIKFKTVSSLIESMYRFNERHAESSKMASLSVKDYPWLFDELERMLEEGCDRNMLNTLKTTLKKHEADIHYRLWPSEQDAATIDIKTLKRNPERILTNWEKYFEECEKNHYSGAVYRFVRSVRWYNDIPVKFVERCVRGIMEDRNGHLLRLLASLVDGETFAEFIVPLLPTENKIDVRGENAKESFSLIHSIPEGMKVADPPVPLELIERLCSGDYLASALPALNNSCRRTSVAKVIPFAKHLSSQRVSVAKHGIRLMDMVDRIEHLCEFLSAHWNQEEHYSARIIVFEKAQHLFSRMPGPMTWSLMKMLISTIAEKEEPLLSPWPFSVRDVPNEYAAEYMKMVLEMIDRLEHGKKSYARSFVESIDTRICNILPEEFLKELLKRYLFDKTRNKVSPANATLTLLTMMYFETTGERLERRLEVFSGIFVEAVRSEWKVPDSPLYRSNALRILITRIVYSKLKPEIWSVVINRVLETFLSVLTHEDDAKCYLLLIYAREWTEAKAPKEFANRIGEKLTELMQMYTPLFSYYIADALKDFLTQSNFGDRGDVLREVAEALGEFGTIEACYTAVQVLLLRNKKNDVDSYVPLLMKLGKTDHPAVKSLVNYMLQ